jgi:nicotinamidase-related amidase
MPTRTFDARTTAVLAMDCQRAIVSAYAKPRDEFLTRAADVLRAARAAGLTVVHVQVAFRPGFPEISSNNALFAAIKTDPQRQQLFAGDGAAIDPGLGPEQGDLVVSKRRVSAFAGSDLALLLRAQEVETLVLFGIATSGVVLSTLTEAFDADYRLAVIADCCVDSDADLHAALVERYFPKRADVITAREFLERIGGRQQP